MNIKAEREFLPIFLDKVRNGEFLIPEFQREFVWDDNQVEALFDSILKGFPIGSITLWAPRDKSIFYEPINDIEGVIISDNNSDNSKSYVLDGRQRITSLICSLCDNGNLANKVFINLEDDDIFVRRNISSKQSFADLSLYQVFDPYNLVEYLGELKASNLSEEKKKQYADKAKSINKILSCYEIGYMVMNGGDLNDAEEIFKRLNSNATPVGVEYLIQASLYKSSNRFKFNEKILDICTQIDDYGFGKISKDIVIKCIYNHTKHTFVDGRMQHIIELGEKGSLENIINLVAEEISTTANFLYSICGVVDYKLLPYTYQFVMLADFFRTNRVPNQEQLKDLRKWFFYTSYCSFFTNKSLSDIRKDITMFREFVSNPKQSPVDYNNELLNFERFDKLTRRGVRTKSFILVSLLRKYQAGFEEGKAYEYFNWAQKTLSKQLANKNDSTILFDDEKRMVNQIMTGQEQQLFDIAFERFCKTQKCSTINN